MKLSYILIQALGLCGTLLFFVSFQCRENKNLYRVQLFSYLLYSVHLLLLGAVTGGISYIINTFRSVCLGSKWKFAHTWTMCVIICVMQIITLYFTWNGPISLLPIIANIAATIGGYTHNPKKVRIAGMFINSPLWIAYSIIVGSWAGILDEVVSELSMIISVIRFGWADLDKVEFPTE